MLQVAPGVFVAPKMRKAIRERLWKVMLDWSEYMDTEGGVVMFWRDRSAPSGLGMRLIGWPKRDLIHCDGIWLTISDLTADYSSAELKKLANAPIIDTAGTSASLAHLFDGFIPCEETVPSLPQPKDG